MLDNDTPTTDGSDSTDGAATAPAAPVKAPRRRATKATAAPTADPTAGPASAADATTDPPGAGDPADGAAEAAPAKKAPAKRTAKKAPAKKVAAKSAESTESTDNTATAATSDSADAADASDVVEVTDGALKPRTRRRASVAVPFQPPVVEETPTELAEDDAETDDETAAETASENAAESAAAAEPAADGDGTAAPRRRRRAGTTGAIAPATFLAAVPSPVDSDSATDETDEAGDDDEAGEDGDRPRSRRRRGRRGRGRRPEGEGTEGEDADGEDTDGEDADAAPATARTRRPATRPASGTSGTGSTDESDDSEGADGTDDESEDDGGEGGAAGTARRRRRRRRSGSGGGADLGTDDPPGTVVHVREPQARQQRVRGASAADEDGVRGISGSTRMAAKRARRQEGRDSGRRRPPILTEAEFLARREAVDRQMLVRQKGDRTQIAVLEDGILVEHYVTKASAQSFAGNVYLGRVQNVLPSMEAAFIDIGKGRNAVLYAGEVNYDLLGAGGGNQARKIESVLSSGQEVLVQVTKDPLGHKGARLTSQISLPGRYLVYVPEGSMTGISRKLPENERTRLKSILKKIVPDDAGVIIRTAAEGVGEEEIERDVRRLQAQWEVIKTKSTQGGAPTLLHAEPDLVIKVVRDVFNEDFTSLVVQGESEWETIRDYVEFVAPDLTPRLSRWEDTRDVFAAHRVDEQIAKGLERKVWLPSGGSLVIDRTEAMVVIDVNTGKYVGKGGNLEETVTRNNLEAAEEVARQLRLRDLGGIIVIDFIDMVLESNRDLVVRRLVECLGRDRTKHQVAEVTSLGLVQMTRKRVGQGLLESFSETCEHCNGRGYLTHAEPIDRKESTERFDDRPSAEQRRRDQRDSQKDRERGPKPGAPVRSATPASTGDAPADDATGETGEESTGPKRRRRGGRGAGSSTPPAPAVDPADELKEIEAGTPDPTPESSSESSPELTPDPADVTPVEELADAELAVGDAVQNEPEVEPAPEPEPEPDPDPEPDPEPAADPAPEARPRRRRATSRPAGPPTQE
ncbi:MAG: Rne/Rng family ribonuclease [Mycobacteriales bacterium]|nr:Rne/Rng family ribonuclease [Mycobacteriales bacterium]